MTCPQCGREFTPTAKQISHAASVYYYEGRRRTLLCSRPCARRYNPVHRERRKHLEAVARGVRDAV